MARHRPPVPLPMTVESLCYESGSISEWRSWKCQPFAFLASLAARERSHDLGPPFRCTLTRLIRSSRWKEGERLCGFLSGGVVGCGGYHAWVAHGWRLRDNSGLRPSRNPTSGSAGLALSLDVMLRGRHPRSLVFRESLSPLCGLPCFPLTIATAVSCCLQHAYKYRSDVNIKLIRAKPQHPQETPPSDRIGYIIQM